MRWSVVNTVFRRELRDVLRDRRTLFTMLVLPVILYPALMIGFSRVAMSRAEKLRERTYPVLVSVDGRAVTDRGDPLAADHGLLKELLDLPQFELQEAEDPGEAVATGALSLAIDLPGDLEARLARGEEVRLVPRHRSADDGARAVLQAFEGAIRRFRQSHFPLVVDDDAGDMATPEQRGGHAFGGMLAMMVVMMAMTGAFYPALDVAAGEKERGTLETLLLSPASRLELVTGKYLTVLAVAVVAALMNLASMTFTFAGFSSAISSQAGGLNFSISPAAVAVTVLGLIIVASLFSAVCLALSTFARTYKEGQAYLTPALILVMPLGMIALLPDMELDTRMAVIPVANMALLMKGLLVGKFPVPEILITLVTSFALAVAALLWTVSLFQREEVLFREGKQLFGLRPPLGVPRPVRPPVQAAVLATLLGLVVMVNSGTFLTRAPLVAQIVVPLLLLLLVAVGLTTLSMVKLRTGLGLRAPSSQGWVAAVLVGLGGVAVSEQVARWQRVILGDPASDAAVQQLQEALGELLRTVPIPVALLALAVVPAVAEEILFRGLVLRSLIRPIGPMLAILVTALVFAGFHMSAHRFFPQAVLGLMLGWLALRLHSVWPAVLAHAVHNGVTVLVAHPDDPLGVASGGADAIPTWVSMVGIALAMVGLVAAKSANSPTEEGNGS